MKKSLCIICIASALSAATLNKDAASWGFVKDGYQVIDVRTPSEWAAKSIDGTYKISLINDDGSVNRGFVDDVMGVWDGKSTIVLMCRSGQRSAKAARVLEKSGFSGDIINLVGGINKVDINKANAAMSAK